MSILFSCKTFLKTPNEFDEFKVSTNAKDGIEKQVGASVRMVFVMYACLGALALGLTARVQCVCWQAQNSWEELPMGPLGLWRVYHERCVLFSIMQGNYELALLVTARLVLKPAQNVHDQLLTQDSSV